MSIDTVTVSLVWNKAHYIDPSHESAGFRKDDFGSIMHKASYGNRDSTYGWEVDHIIPVSRGGSDALSNLRPLQWANNVRRGNGW